MTDYRTVEVEVERQNAADSVDVARDEAMSNLTDEYTVALLCGEIRAVGETNTGEPASFRGTFVFRVSTGHEDVWGTSGARAR